MQTDFIIQTYFSDKISLKQVQIKKTKKLDLALENRFFILTFWGAFCH
jgi:hypothetical protein